MCGFYSAFNADGANSDGSGTTAMRLTRIYLDRHCTRRERNQSCGTLLWQRDTNDSRTIDAALTARSSSPATSPMTFSRTPPTAPTTRRSSATAIAPDEGDPVEWIDNDDGSLDLTRVVAVAVRLVIDKKMGGTPSYADLSTTVRLRNVVGEEE